MSKLKHPTITLMLFIVVSVELSACDSNNSAVIATATSQVNTQSITISVNSPKIVGSVVPPTPLLTNTPALVAEASSLKIAITSEVNRAENIIWAKVTKIGDLVWNTPDNEEPTNFSPVNLSQKYPGVFVQQFAQVELTVTKTYKGKLSVGEKTTLLIGSAPNSKPFGGSSWFPKLNEERLWLTGSLRDYRLGKGKAPLIFPDLQQYYVPQSDGTLLAPNNNPVTIGELENAINNPIPDPTRVPRTVVSTPTPRIKPNQAINIVQMYGLDKVDFITVKGLPGVGIITDVKTIKAIIAILDKPLITNANPDQPQDTKPGETIFLVFTFIDGHSLGFEYNGKVGSLTLYSPDILRIPAPAELASAVGWTTSLQATPNVILPPLASPTVAP